MAMMSIADAYKSAIAEEMRRDPSVFVLGEDEDIPGGMGGAFTVRSAASTPPSPKF